MAIGLSAQFLGEVGAEQALFENSAIPVIDGQPARLICCGKPTGFLDGRLAAIEAGARLGLALFEDNPARVTWVNPVAVPTQHAPPSQILLMSLSNARSARRVPAPRIAGGGQKNRDRQADPGSGCGWQARDRETLPNRTAALPARVRRLAHRAASLRQGANKGSAKAFPASGISRLASGRHQFASTRSSAAGSCSL